MTATSAATPTLRALTLAGLAALVTACTVVGPEYERPTIEIPPAYKEGTALKTQPASQAALQGRWWEIYGDRELDVLMAQVESQNRSLQAAQARMQRSLAMLEAARAAQSPTVVAGGRNDFGILANWEIDLWGRIRRTVEASGASTQASAADLAAATLSMQAQVAQNYFQLRVQDTGIQMLQDTVQAYERALQMTRNQYNAGLVSGGNVAQAQAQLSAAQAQMHNARVVRAQLEHAIAVMVGKAPAALSIAVAPLAAQVPEVPPVLPTELLARRPDIAAAERRMAAASAQIGVAEAGLYPSLDLFIGASIRKGLIGGADVRAPLYAGGSPQARRRESVAAYDEVVADYRQTVLNSLREVEDNLATLEILAEAATAQDSAVKSARESARITNNQYAAGVVSYLPVVVVQTTALENQRAALDTLGRRLVASVNLIKALGGGWDATTLNAEKK